MSWGDRWERLFADLEITYLTQERRELDSEVADRTRRDRAQVHLLERLCAHRGHPLECRLDGGARVQGRVVDVGGDWLALAPSPHRAVLVPLSSLASLVGLGVRSADTTSARRMTLGFALRELSRNRAAAQVTDRFGATFEGTVDVVGFDFLDLAEHPIDESRRPGNVRSVRTIPFAAIACVQTGG